MARYMIQISEPVDAYLHTLDLVRKETPHLLEEMWWGFMEGEFVGWLMVESTSEEEARHMLPTALQSDAHIAEICRYTSAEIENLHRQMVAV